MAIRKLCAKTGCDEVADEGASYCTEHLAERQRREAERQAAAQRSDQAQKGRRLYRLAAWRKGRLAFLTAKPLCVHCAEVGKVEPAVDVDHIVPHRGDMKLFLDRRNWQGLCKACHSRKTASETLNRR
ncbi:HNH endonuclease signature motif containing protein [Pseudoroseicyclus aestuarii]|uniref:Putative HNH nuclease YajD n=1 Tax=Pseudoroseicyclus aestuarii TaxID=1795041 RepID=A0A318SM93_9RHOB|nr:HNH endonuclease signature motif containing protein [Pseudoroseicyclus aestuarii]PYE80826.1 5-methylcytosine-specific restriction protein A [Pseudoroseicyclus aestuarii]